MLTRFSFDLDRWPRLSSQVIQFEPDLETMKTYILSKIHDDCSKTNVTSRIFTMVSFVTQFLLKMTQFQSRPRNHQDKHFEQDS